jgi:hypothetical protein
MTATGRPEDAVACPACGNGPGNSCDGPSSHPSRLKAHAPRTGAEPEHPPCCADSYGVARCIRCSEFFCVQCRQHVEWHAEWTRLLVASMCGSCSQQDAFRPERITLPAGAAADWVINDIKIGNAVVDGATASGTIGFEIEVPNPSVHRPRIARTMLEGPGNRTLVRGCSCGAATMSAETYADHVGWPVEAVRALLDLVGIADDLLDYHGEMTHEGVWQEISRCLEIRR